MKFKDSFGAISFRRCLGFAAALFLATAVFAFILERHCPYYFLQDDNRDITLPYIFQTYHALVNYHEITQYNFHQFLGLPTTFLTYPPSMLGAWLSEKLLGNLWGAVDALAFVWMLVAGLGFFAFCSGLGLGVASSALGAVAWAFCPFTVFMQTSWWIVGTASACFPWMALGTGKLYASGGRKGFALLASSLGLLALMSHPQYALHGCAVLLLFALAMPLADAYDGAGGKTSWQWVWQTLAQNRRFLLVFFAALVLGWLLAALTVLPSYAQMRGTFYRNGAALFCDFDFRNFALLKWLKGMVWPYGGVTFTGADIGQMDKLAFLGYPAQGLAVFLFLPPARKFFAQRRNGIIVFAGLALFCFVWSLGGFNWYEYLLPFFNRLRWHFRIMLFADFFFCLLAALGLQAVASIMKNRTAVYGLLVLQLLNMGLFYGLSPRLSFRTHRDAVPAAEPLAARLLDGRILTVGFAPDDAFTMPSLGFDYATLFGLDNFAGYDVLLPVANKEHTLGLNYTASYNDWFDAPVLAQLRLWGVKYYVTAPYSMYRYAKFYTANGFGEIYRDGGRVVFEDLAALPQVSRPPSTDAAGSVQLRGNSLVAALSKGEGGCYKVNWLFVKGMTVMAEGGAELSSYPSGQMRVCVRPGVKAFTLRYTSPWIKMGMRVSIIALCALAAALVFL